MYQDTPTKEESVDTKKEEPVESNDRNTGAEAEVLMDGAGNKQEMKEEETNEPDQGQAGQLDQVVVTRANSATQTELVMLGDYVILTRGMTSDVDRHSVVAAWVTA